jgi:hypothetical protein
MSQTNPFSSDESKDKDTLSRHEIARVAHDYLKSNNFDPASRRKIATLEKYGSVIADSIESLDISYPQNNDIRNNIDTEVERKGVVGESLNFFNEKYHIGEKYKENNQYTRWKGWEFETDDMKKVSEVLQGFTESLD